MGGFLQYQVGLHQSSTSRSASGLSTLLLLRVFAPTVSPTAIFGALPADFPQPFFFPFLPPTSFYNEKKKSPMDIMVMRLRLWLCWISRHCYIICQWSDELQLTISIRNGHKLLLLFKNSLQESLQLQLLPIIICKLWQLHPAFSYTGIFQSNQWI